MTDERDDGIRCDRHVGEVFPPRCDDCLEAASAAIRDRLEQRALRASEVRRSIEKERRGATSFVVDPYTTLKRRKR